MKKYLLFFFISFTSFASRAQIENLVAIPNTVSDPLAEFNKNVAANWNGRHYRIGPFNVKGSPFLFGQSFQGAIAYKGNMQGKANNVFYDIYNQQAGIDINGDLGAPHEPVESFSLSLPEQFGGTILHFKKANLFGENNVKGFFAVLSDGPKVSLLKYFKAILMTDPVNQMDRDAKVFQQIAEYYLFQKETKSLKKIKLKEKEITKDLDATAVKNVLNTNKYDFSTEADVIKFVSNYQ